MADYNASCNAFFKLFFNFQYLCKDIIPAFVHDLDILEFLGIILYQEFEIQCRCFSNYAAQNHGMKIQKQIYNFCCDGIIFKVCMTRKQMLLTCTVLTTSA